MRRSSRRNIVKSAAGYVVEALEGRTLLSFQANVNFQDAIAGLPEGYLRDRGEVYGNRIGGGTYGWDADNSANARNRDTEPDQRLDTFNHMQLGGANRSWSISVPNDTYRVRIVAGDPDAFDSVYKIAAEGVTVVNGTPDTNNRWVTGTQSVTVTDGQLTITNAAGSSNNKICYIEIVDDSRLASVPAVPTNVKALAETTTKVNLTWTDNADNDTAYKVERSPNGTSGWTLFDRYSDATFFGDVTGLSANTTWYYRVRSANPAGFSAWSDIVQVTTPATNTQTPYNATSAPWAIGTVIEAENYDRGGEGVASHDVDTTNSGGLYRTGYVDIIRYTAYAQVGTFVGFNEAGEWLEYTINVPQNGTYRLEASVSNRDAGDGLFHMSVDGVDKTGLMMIPDTGAWTTFQTLTKSGISLTAGQHILRVTIDSIGTNQSAAGNINWFNFVLTSSASVPTAPSNLTRVEASSSHIIVSWADNSSNETGFELDRSTSSTFSSGITTVTLDANTESYIATDLTAGTNYYFRVRATNLSGDSVNSNIASITTLAAPTTPAAPSNLTAMVVSASQINVIWTDNSTNETGFEVDRSTSATFASGVVTATVPADFTSYAANGLTANTTYYFRVRSTNGSGDSVNSGTASARTSAPAAPTGLSAAAMSATNISLSWTDNANDESGFEIDQATNSAFSAGLATIVVDRNITSYIVTGLAASTQYWFRVRATNAVGESSNSGAISATTNANPATPAAPTALAAAVATSTQVNLDWADSAGTGITYNVYRGTTAGFAIGTGSRIALAVSQSRYVDAGIPSSGTYYYKVTAVKSGVESLATTTSGQNTTVTPPPPAAISNFSAEWDPSANGGSGAVVLSWTDNSLGESQFVFTRTDVDGTSHTLTAPTNATQLVDVGPFPISPPQSPSQTPGQTTGPVYQGQSQNTGGTSAPGPTFGPVYIPNAGIIAPYNLTAQYSGSQFTLRWSHNGSAAGYDIERLNVNTATWQTLNHVGNVRSFVIDPYPGSFVSYRVKAVSNTKVSIPLRTIGPADPASEAQKAKVLAVSLLNQEEAKHSAEPYYTYNMSVPFPQGIRGLFDRLAIALDASGVQIDAGLSTPARYLPNTNQMLLRSNPSSADVCHELVHAVDDMMGWYIEGSVAAFSSEQPEALAYAIEYLLRSLGNTENPRNPNTMDNFTLIPLSTTIQAQQQWTKAWGQIDATIGKTVHYQFFGEKKRSLTTADMQDALTKFNITISQAALLPVYNTFLETLGFAPNTMTSVTVNPIFA